MPEPKPENEVLVNLLSDALQRQNDTNKDGFDRLETGLTDVVRVVQDGTTASQRDFRIMAAILLLGLLATMGVNISGSWGDAVVSLSPVATAAETPVEAEDGSR